MQLGTGQDFQCQYTSETGAQCYLHCLKATISAGGTLHQEASQ